MDKTFHSSDFSMNMERQGIEYEGTCSEKKGKGGVRRKADL